MKTITLDLLREMLKDDESVNKIDSWLENYEPISLEFRGRWYFVQRMEEPMEGDSFCSQETH